MLGWLTGFAHPVDAQALQLEGDQSRFEEPPETPAPLFAVRAFKTAIFGTPHPSEINDSKYQSHTAQKQAAKPLESALLDKSNCIDGHKQGLNEEPPKLRMDPLASPAKGILLTPGTGTTRRKTVSFGGLANDATERTKQSNRDSWTSEDVAVNRPKSLKADASDCAEEHPQKSLSKTLFKAQIDASKRRMSTRVDATESDAKALSISAKNDSTAKVVDRTNSAEENLDTTIDLSQPRSRSGQHWKAEYELYHKNSSREMKKVIKYGQNVKSYAVKKDAEATGLGEKLKRKLSQLASLEIKVSELTEQLYSSRQQGPEAETERLELVTKLAKQTALVISYEEKADNYRNAIKKARSVVIAETNEDGKCAKESPEFPSHGTSMNIEVLEDPLTELESLRGELDKFRKGVRSAEDKATKLEAENLTLKKSLARVKEEMSSYETRRQVREQRLRRREARLEGEKRHCEARLAHVTLKYESLCQVDNQKRDEQDIAASQHCIQKPKTVEEPAAKQLGRVDNKGHIPRKEIASSTAGHPDLLSESPSWQRRRSIASDAHEDEELSRQPESKQNALVSQPEYSETAIPKSPRHGGKKRAGLSDVDIWTMKSPENTALNTSSANELAKSSQFDLLRRETNRALEEIDQNLVSEQQIHDHISYEKGDQPANDMHVPRDPPAIDSSILPALPSHEPSMSSAVRRMRERKSTISSPRPSMVSLASSPHDPATSGPSSYPANPPKNRHALLAGSKEPRSLSMVSSGTRASTMTSARGGGSLPADRAAAAKARLQKRSTERMEKHRLRERSNVAET